MAEEASALAQELGLPPNWLNPRALMRMPPLPAGVLDPPASPGLRVTYADDEFLLATKLVAQRRKDADDVRVLTQRLGVVRDDVTSTSEALRDVVQRHYEDVEGLRMLLGCEDVETEVALLADDAARFVHRATGDDG